MTTVRSMEELERAALEILARRPESPISCGCLGDELFVGRLHKGTAPFARITGKIMKRLENKSLAFKRKQGVIFGWVISQQGLNAVGTGG